MTEEQLKEKLNGYYNCVREIGIKKILIEELKDKRGLRASQGSEVYSNFVINYDEVITDKIFGLETEISNLKQKSLVIYEETINLINTIDNDIYNKILYARHINLKKWNDISKEIPGYSCQHIRGYLYNNAVKELLLKVKHDKHDKH